MQRDVAIGWAQCAAWVLGAAWCWRAYQTLTHMPRMPRLNDDAWATETNTAWLTVIVPARNEEAKLAATLEALAAQQLERLRIVVIDDRSIDATGAIADDFAARFPERMQALHVTELPRSWLGKTYAMQQGLMASESEYVLFTDADIVFSPSVLRRALAYAVRERADHLVVPPTLDVKSWREAMVLGVFQTMGAWALRSWRVADPDAQRDAIGMGAFNMVRRAALAQIGGLAPQRLVVIEDVILGRRMKTARLRQRLVYAPGMIRLHWAAGARGIVGVLTKNLFAVFGFRITLALAATLAIAAAFLAPVVGLFWWHTTLPCALALVSMASMYTTYAPISGVPRRAVFAMPLGVLTICYAIARSVVVTLKDGGVRWRGTLYPLREIKAQNTPWRWAKKTGL